MLVYRKSAICEAMDPLVYLLCLESRAAVLTYSDMFCVQGCCCQAWGDTPQHDIAGPHSESRCWRGDAPSFNFPVL